MPPLQRLSSFIIRTGEADTARIAAGKNVGDRILYDIESDIGRVYIQHPPIEERSFLQLPLGYSQLGEYEAKLLGMIKRPTSSVICVTGGMGCGKSTTTRFLIDHVLAKVPCEACSLHEVVSSCERMIARINCLNLDRDIDRSKLLRALCNELDVRSDEFIGDEEEMINFWERLYQEWKQGTDEKVQPVVATLMSTDPRLFAPKGSNHKAGDIEKRLQAIRALRDEDHEWWFRYLVLRWRYLVTARFNSHRECALIILDNLDFIEPSSQQVALDLVNKAQHPDGPTFILLMRPETYSRHGRAFDYQTYEIEHKQLPPSVVIRHRLDEFMKNPDRYFSDVGLSKSDQETVRAFLLRANDVITGQDAFSGFIDSASGDSIRLALRLAEGIFLCPRYEMMREKQTPHSLVRACLTRGRDYFQSAEDEPIQNLFTINGVRARQRLTLKLRLLGILFAREDQQLSWRELHSVLEQLGYESRLVEKALTELTRPNCQLVRSNRHDVFDENALRDDGQALALTRIGAGYYTYLIYDLDYVQEVMLDSQVDSASWSGRRFVDRIPDRLQMLRLFLDDLICFDLDEMKSFRDRNEDLYLEWFDQQFITLEMLKKLHTSIERLAVFFQKNNYVSLGEELSRLLPEFDSLGVRANQRYQELFGAEPFTR